MIDRQCSTGGCPPLAPGLPNRFSAATRITRLRDHIPLTPALIFSSAVTSS